MLKCRAPRPCPQGLVSEAEVGSENLHFFKLLGDSDVADLRNTPSGLWVAGAVVRGRLGDYRDLGSNPWSSTSLLYDARGTCLLRPERSRLLH